MWRRIDCAAIYTEDIERSVEFYSSLGLVKDWEAFQDAEQRWRLVGMRFPAGDARLVLKNNPALDFTEIEIVVDDVRESYQALSSTPGVGWISAPRPNPLGGHVAVLEAPDGNAFVLIGD
jgi:catechol 2,3-dioxygenase-like lactoylglutathione lyase family enzyme